MDASLCTIPCVYQAYSNITECPHHDKPSTGMFVWFQYAHNVHNVIHSFLFCCCNVEDSGWSVLSVDLGQCIVMNTQLYSVQDTPCNLPHISTTTTQTDRSLPLSRGGGTLLTTLTCISVGHIGDFFGIHKFLVTAVFREKQSDR